MGEKTGRWMAAALLVALAGCEEGANPGRDAGTEPPADSGSVQPDGALATDGGLGVDAFVPPPVDGDPNVPRVHVGHVSWEGVLTVLKHNIVLSDGGLEEYYVLVRNDHPTDTVCSVIMEVDVIGAAGAVITSESVLFDGEPRAIHSVDADCIPPGFTALGYGNSFTPVPRESVTRLDYFFRGSSGSGSDVRVFASVADDGLTVVDPYGGGTYSAIRGTLRVTSGSILNPSVTFFPIDSRGLPYDSLSAIELTTLSVGQTLPYTTTATEIPFTTYLTGHSYRDGSSPILRSSPEIDAAIEARTAHDAARDAAEARTR